MAELSVPVLQLLKGHSLNGVVKHLLSFVITRQFVQNDSLDYPPDIEVGKFPEQFAREPQSKPPFSSFPGVEHLAVDLIGFAHPPHWSLTAGRQPGLPQDVRRLE